MANLNVEDMVGRLRATLNQWTIAGERVMSADQNVDLASSTFSDVDLAERLYDAVCDVAARVKPTYLSGLWVNFNPTSSLDSWNNYFALRKNKANLNGAFADRMTFADFLRLSSKRPPTNAKPVFIFEDMEFRMVADSEGSSDGSQLANADIQGVREPRVMDGITQVEYFQESDVLTNMEFELDEMFAEHVILFASRDCYATLSAAQTRAQETWSALASAVREDYFRKLRPFARFMYSLEDEDE